MNAERLHAITVALRADIKTSQVVTELDQLVQHLANLVNSPGNASYQDQLSQSRTKVIESLRSAKVNKFSPTWMQVVEEMGAANLIGGPLADRISDIFSRNQITPAVALQELQQLQSEVRELAESLAAIANGFSKLYIGREDLEPGECELGVLIPRLFVKNQLGDFAEELEDINRILGVFSEITTGSRPGFEIKTISSSDLSIFLDLDPVTAAAVATAIERIVALYKNLLEIRKHHAQLSESGVPKESLAGIEDYANNAMSEGIQKITDEMIKEKDSSIDTARKNELSTDLRLALSGLATRIDCGFNIEVRMEDPSIPSDSIDQGETLESELLSSYSKIQKATNNMRFLKLEGEPILRLKDGRDKGDTPKA